MSVFAVSYDLNHDKDYKSLRDELQRLGGVSPTNSFYLINVNESRATNVRDHLKRFIDDDDWLMVVPVGGEPAFTKARRGTNAWLEKTF